jgi:hypothetical protein
MDGMAAPYVEVREPLDKMLALGSPARRDLSRKVVE